MDETPCTLSVKKFPGAFSIAAVNLLPGFGCICGIEIYKLQEYSPGPIIQNKNTEISEKAPCINRP
jgi:hypothetical protein